MCVVKLCNCLPQESVATKGFRMSKVNCWKQNSPGAIKYKALCVAPEIPAPPVTGPEPRPACPDIVHEEPTRAGCHAQGTGLDGPVALSSSACASLQIDELGLNITFGTNDSAFIQQHFYQQHSPSGFCHDIWTSHSTWSTLSFFSR